MKGATGSMSNPDNRFLSDDKLFGEIYGTSYRELTESAYPSNMAEVLAIFRSIAPFIKESLARNELVTRNGYSELSDFVKTDKALMYFPAAMGFPAYVAACFPITFYDRRSGRPFYFPTVVSAVHGCLDIFEKDYGLGIMDDMSPLPGGFTGLSGRHKRANALRIMSI